MAINATDYALIIGINDYPKYDFPLKGARKDAEEFAKWVNNTEIGGGVPEENTVILLSKISDDGLARPVHEEIDDKLLFLINKALENQENTTPRRFYFYFSGHGLGLSADDVGLCLPFWSSDTRAASALKLSGYRAYLQEWGLFPEIFIFLDCCRVSLQVAGGYDPTLTLAKPRAGAADSRYLTAFASTYTNPAFEAETNKDAAKSEIRGFFTQSLLEALNGAAAREEGGVPVDNLLRYLDGRVSQLAALSDKKQKATYLPSFSQTDMPQIILGSATVTKLESMASGDPSEVFPFIINKPAGTGDVEITVMNSNFDLIYRGFGAFNQPLPRGKYQLRFQFSDQLTEKIIVHKSPETVYELSPLPTYSAVLLQGAASSHEYYTEYAMQWSRTMTDATDLNAQSDSGFFFFARFPNKEDAINFDLFKDLDLLDEKMKVVHNFPKETYKEDRATGWFAFSVRCGKGQYYLRLGSNPARMIPIYCFPNWQSQVFVAVKGQDLVLETLRILTAPLNQGFVPNDWASLSDTAFEYLKRPELELPPSLAQTLLYRKFDTPMLGILGAYLVLQRKMDDLMDSMPIIIQNLTQILQSPDAPDLKAIQALYAPEKHHDLKFDHPPMISFGTEGIIKLDIRGEVEILTSSVFENMTPLRKNDLLSTSWCQGKYDTPVVEAWVMNAVVDNVAYARKQLIVLDIRLLARQISIPVSQVQMALDFIVENPSTFENIWAVKQDPKNKEDILADLIYLQKNKKMPTLKAPVNIITIFAPDAYELLKELRENCLKILETKNLITQWDTDIMLPGSIRRKVIDEKIEGCQIFIGLVSVGYISPDSEAYSMHQQALEAGKIFIPIIAKPGYYDLNPEIEAANPIPRQGGEIKPLGLWTNRDEAWPQITRMIVDVVKNLG